MITKESDHFFELTQTSNCRMCEVDFDGDFLTRVEVTFSLNRAIEDVDMAAFCLPPPVLDPKVNLAVMPGETGDDADVIDQPGTYRYFCPITLAKGLLRVEGDRTDTVQAFKVIQQPSLRYEPLTVSCHPGPVHFELVNNCDKISGIFIIPDDLPGSLSLSQLPPRLTGLEVIHYPEYRRLFGDQVLSQQEQLHVASVTLMFTDIADSTQKYEAIGDSVAYNLVREHFEVLFQAIEAHGGFVVKTIGDAVMASFTSNHDALTCAQEALRAFHRRNAGLDDLRKLHVKIGMHRGPAILVNLNGHIDYFGSTVNKAARIQGYAGADEITFSPEARDERLAAAAPVGSIREDRAMLKGITAEQTFFRLSIADP